MLKFKHIIIFITLLFIIPVNVNAGTLKQELEKNYNTIKADDILIIDINLTAPSEVKINEIVGNISYDKSVLELISKSPASSLKDNFDKDKFILKGTLKLNNASTRIYSLAFKVKETTELITSIVVYGGYAVTESGEKQAYNEQRISVNIESNLLKNIKINNESPSNFNSYITTYNYDTKDSKIVINATSISDAVTIKGTGAKSVNYGENIFNIVIVSSNGKEKKYTIVVNRIDTRSDNGDLKTLKIENNNIELRDNQYYYSYKTTSNTIDIKAVLKSNKSIFEDNHGPRKVTLNYGDNTVIIKTIAENGKKTTYTLKITRDDIRSSNNYLKELNIKNFDFTFDKMITEYKIAVNNNIEKLEIEAIPEDPKAKVEIFNNDLNIGINQIVINVYAENKKIKIYKIIVEKQAPSISIDEEVENKEEINDKKNNLSESIKTNKEDFDVIPILIAIWSMVIVSCTIIYIVYKKKNNI